MSCARVTDQQPLIKERHRQLRVLRCELTPHLCRCSPLLSLFVICRLTLRLAVALCCELNLDFAREVLRGIFDCNQPLFLPYY